MEVLFEDNHLLVVNKPAGWIVQGAQPDQRSLLDWARTYIKEKYAKPGNVFIGVTSRLDAPVTGAVPLARTSKAASRLSEQLRNNTVSKVYWAIVEGSLPESHGRLENWLIRDASAAITRVVAKQVPNAQLGILEYRRVGSTSLGQLVEILLVSGRKHQIRAQLSHLGCPIRSDKRYGAKQSIAHGIALHCRRLAFKHPTRDEEIVVTASVPDYWQLDSRRDADPM
jgi:23S rRNA pseudouridine1911/1915/1917 synthase